MGWSAGPSTISKAPSCSTPPKLQSAPSATNQNPKKDLPHDPPTPYLLVTSYMRIGNQGPTGFVPRFAPPCRVLLRDGEPGLTAKIVFSHARIHPPSSAHRILPPRRRLRHKEA